jgi:hypothetical protein
LLVVCDQDRFEVHTNFTGTRPHVYRFTLDDLLTNAATAICALPPLEVLRDTFTDPELLRPERAAARVTEAAAAEFAKLADSLEQRGAEPQAVAHFLMRLLFCLFADSIGLLPDHLFRQMIELNRATPAAFSRMLRQLFAAMSTSGNNFGFHKIHWFNGGLFADDSVFDLTSADMGTLSEPTNGGVFIDRGGLGEFAGVCLRSDVFDDLGKPVDACRLVEVAGAIE